VYLFSLVLETLNFFCSRLHISVFVGFFFLIVFFGLFYIFKIFCVFRVSFLCFYYSLLKRTK